ncbi:MAG: InlB B-repeat-containing protein [Clostridia bacterium]|nr:InlB B-repeat-containing protein [Clostridia bacterium]
MKTMKRWLSMLLTAALLLTAVNVGAFSASAASVVPTALVRQDLAKWKNYTYGSGTLYTTGCGMFAIVNAVGYLTGNEMSVTEVASWGHSIGGYNPGSSHDGTYRMTIYPRLQAKYGTRYGFTVDCGSSNEGYWAGSSSTTLKNHLKNGGVAIGHVPGHFIAIVGYDSSTNYFHVYDSYPTSARGTGNGDAWVTQSHLATGKLKLDWFCLLSRTGTVINNESAVTKYTVKFDSRGGSSVATQTIKEGAYATNPGAPTRDGFEFLGWYDENGWLFTFDTTGIWANRTLHAEWKAVKWPISTNYMPQKTNTTVEAYSGSGDSYVWPNFNAYTGAVTMYKGGADYGWPSMLTTYQTSVDLSKDAYLNLSVSATAKFNAVLIFRDADAQTHQVSLSQMINGNDEDFPAGTYTLCASVGYYVYTQGWNMPADSIVNIEAIRYYVVGDLDQYVSLNHVMFSGNQWHTNLMNPDTITQDAIAGTAGTYTYQNGELAMEGNGGYTVTFSPNVTFSPKDQPYWVVSLGATTNFDLSITVTTSDGDRRIAVSEDYYNLFGYDTRPENGMNGGTFVKSFNLLEMYQWHGILPSDGKSTVKAISVELRGTGRLVLRADQLSNTPIEHYYTDAVTKSGSWTGDVRVENEDYVLNTDTDVLLTTSTGRTVAQTKNNMQNGEFVRLFDGDVEVSGTSLAKTGMIVKVMSGNTLLAQYTLAIQGDVDSNGAVNTSDIRRMLVGMVNSQNMTVSEEVAADVDGDGKVSTLDSRSLLMKLL